MRVLGASERRRRRRTKAALLVGTVLLFALTASGREETIVLVRPPPEDPLRAEAFFRLSGELTQQGFRVVAREFRGDPGPSELRRLAGEEGAVAAVSLGGEKEAPEADVWVVDRATGKTTLRTIATDGTGDAPARLALRAGELLRLSLSELEVRTPPPDVVGAEPKLATQPVREYASRERAEERNSFWLGVGVAGATSDGWGVLLAPRVNVQLRFRAPFELALAFTGPGGGGAFEVDGARADLAHEQLMLEPRWLVPLGDRWSLAFAPAFGLGHFSVRGTATEPWRPREASAWAALLGGRAAVRFELLRHLRLSLGAEVDVPLPSLEVEAAERVRRLGPFLGGSGTLEVGF